MSYPTLAYARLSLVLLTVLLAAGCGATEPPTPATPELGSFGVDLSARDDTVAPGEDFFQYASGTWLATTAIPDDRSRWGAFDALREQTNEQVRVIIEELATEGGALGSPEQQVGDYYASWMDTAAVNERGITPLLSDLERIAAVSDLAGLTRELGLANYMGSTSPIYQSVDIDRRDPDRYVLDVGLGGLGLPDRDYYLDESERFVRIREAYVAHIQQMLAFVPATEAVDVVEPARAILALETQIAELQWPRADRRDRDRTLNPMLVAELSTTYPGFDWEPFLAANGIEALESLNVSHPDVMQALIALIREVPLDTWKAYLRYHVISGNASVLFEDIDDANFAFFGRTLNGQPEQRERGVALVGARESLGGALGRVYVARHFPESSKRQMEDLVENLRRAYGGRIQMLSWMGDATKAQALEKLEAFRPKIAYPDAWQDLSAIEIVPGALFDNQRRVTAFFRDYDAARLDRLTDRDEWFMTPQTVNAYYNPQFNEVVFPAAILQSPFFDPQADPAVNYGAIGAVIGHEMGHGFDDQGSKSDARGVQRDWWTDTDRAAFEELTAALTAQYDQYEAAPDAFVDGRFTLGENIGDLGGLSVAYRAYQLSLGSEDVPILDGLTGTQRFFLGWAQVWKSKIREEALVQRLTSDPHAPAIFRTNGVVRNMDAWYEAFGVRETDALFLPPTERVSIW